MTIINLKNGYYIEIDPLNYTLKQKYIGKTKSGEEKEAVKTLGYYGTMGQAIEEYIRSACRDVTDGETMELKEYAATVDQAARIAAQGISGELGRSAFGFEIDRNFYEKSKNEMLNFKNDGQMSIEDFPEVMP